MSELLKTPLIKAGAGTGKTESLITSVYELFQKFSLDQGREPKLIVCTFTRKASQELKERLFKIAVKEIKDFSSKESAQKAPAFLSYLQSSFLQISTIDGILSRFLKKQGAFIDLNPDFEISYSSVNKKLFDSLAEKFIYDKHFSLLQKFPYPILRDIFLSYINSCLKYKNISFYNRDDFENFNKQRDLILAVQKSKSSLESFVKQHSELSCLDAKKLKEWLKQDEKFSKDDFVPVFEQLKKAGEELLPLFLEKKKNSSVLDIEDLLLFSYDMLKRNPLSAKAFSKEWDYWFIDEYQDTSWLQEQVIQEITQFKNVFCVGDPGQSIYSFRGADPQVFHRREQQLKKPVKILKTNRRSSAQLIGFYNDFFKKEPFIKFKTPSSPKKSSVDPYLSFFTYNKKDEDYRNSVFQSLYHYIQHLSQKGVDYGTIAVLSSRNEDLAQMTNYLRGKGLPVIFHSSKKFSQSRIVLDSLFLLKFLINPYDDVNLKALLRAPYFRLRDQDLADSSYQYHSNKEFMSFWAFIKNKYKESLFVKKLQAYLDNYNRLGLFESFKQALFDSALMDLSYWQDPTSFSLANIWKLLNLLDNKKFSELELFYELLKKEADEDVDHLKSARPLEQSSAVSLMTIHKSKGLEFEHVVLLDFSMSDSPLQKGSKLEDITVFDRNRNKMTTAVPIGGREKSKIKSYGHEIYNQIQNQIKIKEQERLYYVAMTRAKDSLAVFFPHGKGPSANSWLRTVDYFSKIESLLQRDDKNKIWRLHSGFYQQANYNLKVLDCHNLNKKPQLIANSQTDNPISKTVSADPDLQTAPVDSKKNVESQASNPSESKSYPSSAFSNSDISSSRSAGPSAVSDSLTSSYAEPSVVSESLTSSSSKSRTSAPVKAVNTTAVPSKQQKKAVNNYSSKDFIQFITQTESQKKSFIQTKRNPKSPPRPSQKKSDFSFLKTKNILFKSSLGSQLHFFLQKLFYFPFEKLDSLIKSSPFLSQENQEKIKKALLYVQELKEPDISSCFKTGYSEWPFQLKKKNIVLKGQIDLWSWVGKEIYLFDYKSAVSKNVKNQLIFYSWILDHMYQPKAIWMYECYPLNEKIQKTLYQPQHKKLFADWFKSL